MADKTRSQKLKRLVAVQRHLEKIAENDLAETSRQRNEVSRQMDNVIVALGSMEPVHQAFSRSYAERFARLGLMDKQLDMIQQLHETRLRQERAKADRLEESMRDAREDEQRAAADDAVYDVIDQRFAAPASSKLHES